MLIDTEHMVSITEANQNFSSVTRMVDTNGEAIIMKNNVPKYIVKPFKAVESEKRNISDEEFEKFADRLIEENAEALELLAK